MTRRTKIFLGILGGVLVVLVLFFGPGVILLEKLGLEPVCLQGEFPKLDVVPCPGRSSNLPTVTPFPLPTPAQETPIPLIFDDDGSPDGLIALLYFLSNPLYEVKAVTVSAGEAHPQIFAQHLANFLAALGEEDIPVGYGRETPLEGDNSFPEPWRDASDGFWDIPLSPAPEVYSPRPAAALIVEILTESTDPMMVFVSGTHTNLAEALRLDPGIRDNIEGVYVMGGSIYVEGNIESDWPEIHNRVAEWNIWVDPVAAGEVFSSGLPLHIVPLDATNQIVWNKNDAQAWVSFEVQKADSAGNILKWMLQSWSLENAYIWDLVAAVAATDPGLCPEEPLAIEVELEPGPKQGQLILTEEPANVLVCLEPIAPQIKLRVSEIFNQ